MRFVFWGTCNYLGLLENWGRGLITVALLFKLTMVPFHFWARMFMGDQFLYYLVACYYTKDKYSVEIAETVQTGVIVETVVTVER